MSTASHKEIVRRYFAEAVDRRDREALDQLMTPDCVIHRPELPEPVRGVENLKRGFARTLYHEMTTTIEDLIAEGDRVACRLSHRAVYRAEWTSRLGRHRVAGRTVSRPAIVIFRFRDGRIAEEWVSRDELGMLLQLGIVSPEHSAS